MTKILIPRSDSVSAKIIEPSDYEKFFDNTILNDYIVTGFAVTGNSGSNRSVDVATGQIRCKGLHIENSSTGTAAHTFGSDAVHYLYVTVARDSNGEAESWGYSSNTTGTVPTDSVLIAKVTCASGNVTAVDQTYSGAGVNKVSGTRPDFLFGNGEDGNVTISSGTTVSTTKYYENLIVNSTLTIGASPTVIYVKDTLTVNNGGSITVTPAGGAGGVSKVATNGGTNSVGLSPANGNAGGAGNGGGVGGVGGTGGGSGGTGGGYGGGAPTYAGGAGGGTGGAAGSQGSKNSAFNHVIEYLALSTRPNCNGSGGGSGTSAGGGATGGRLSDGSNHASASGAGGTGGAGTRGGDGGQGGGTLVILAKNIIVNSGGSIKANGGNGVAASTSNGSNGGNGAAGTNAGGASGFGGGGGGGGGGGAGGGAGGGGGTLFIIFTSLTETGTIECAGGTGGAGSTTTAGSGGSAGAPSSNRIGNSGNQSYGQAGTAGTAVAGTNGNAGGSGTVLKYKV